MAHCSSSLVHKSSFLVHKSTHHEKPQDLLPPRKRLLAGLKQVKATPVSTPCTPPPPQSPSLQIEVHVDPTHTSSPPPYSLLLRSPTQKCFSCGDCGVLLHRVPSLGGSSSYHCSSCVLALNKSMYCVLCYQVIPEEFTLLTSSGLLTCCRCQRLTHLECALKVWSPSLEGAGLTLCRDCNARNNGQFREPPLKKQKTGSARQSKEAVVTPSKVSKLPLVDMQALAAAQIVAMVAKRGALEAKQRAGILAKAAACAAMHAKTALDNVHQLSQKDTYIRGPDTSVSITEKDEGPMAAPKTAKNLKKRALSAIVASEMLLKRASSPADHIASTMYPDSKQIRTSHDTECAKVKSAALNYVAEEAINFRTHRARLAVKRRKTLSSIGVQHSSPNTCKAAILKSSKLASRRTKISNQLSKGNKLGAIVSQVLASNKFLKSSSKAASCKVSSSGLHCATIQDAIENGGKKIACSMDVMVAKDRLCSE